MKGRQISYSVDELAWIERHSRDDRRDAYAAFLREFGRQDVSLQNFNALCKRKGWLTGRNGRYSPGAVPVNKGKTMPYHPNSAATRFKKGNRPHNTNYEGHERVSRDGYVEISVAERNPHTGFERRYVHKHVWLWTRLNGPVPEGMCLKCLDGNKTNTDPSNWKPISRALLPRLSGRWNGLPYDEAEPELKPVIMAVAELDHTVRQRRSGGRS